MNYLSALARIYEYDGGSTVDSSFYCQETFVLILIRI